MKSRLLRISDCQPDHYGNFLHRKYTIVNVLQYEVTILNILLRIVATIGDIECVLYRMCSL